MTDKDIAIAILNRAIEHIRTGKDHDWRFDVDSAAEALNAGHGAGAVKDLVHIYRGDSDSELNKAPVWHLKRVIERLSRTEDIVIAILNRAIEHIRAGKDHDWRSDVDSAAEALNSGHGAEGAEMVKAIVSEYRDCVGVDDQKINECSVYYLEGTIKWLSGQG